MTSDLLNDYHDIQQIAAGQELQWEDQEGESTFRAGYRLADMLELPALSRGISQSGLSASLPLGNEGPTTSGQSVKGLNISSHTSSIISRSEPGVLSPSEQISQKVHPEMQNDEAECSPAKMPRLAASATINTAPPHSVAGSGNNVNSFDNMRRNRLNSMTDMNNKPSPSKSGGLMDLSQVKVDEIDEKSPDEVFVPKSKFTKLNDTITKCKKYVKVHCLDAVNSEKTASNNELNGTFTMDPEASQIPLSAVPNVDSLQLCRCVKSQIETLNGNPVTNNGIHAGSNMNENSVCAKCSCLVKPHSDITGSQLESHDPNDDSGTSTLMNSQATVSTLNNSQDLSGISEYMDIAYTGNQNNRIRTLSSSTVNLSDTFSKEGSMGSVSHNGTVVSKAAKVHAARSIKFEDGDGSRRGSGGKRV